MFVSGTSSTSRLLVAAVTLVPRRKFSPCDDAFGDARRAYRDVGV